MVLRPRRVAGSAHAPWAAVSLALAVVALAVVAASGCSRPIARARMSRLEPPAPAERAARKRLVNPACSYRWGFLFPGLGQLCTGKHKEGAVMLALGLAEVGTSVAVAVSTDQGIAHPGAALPLLGLQDLWLYGMTDTANDQALARRALFAPRDSLSDLALAPFNFEVMRRPEVWAGTLLAAVVGLGVSVLASGGYDRSLAGGDPNVFGYTVRPAVGYPVAIAAGAGLFSQVAIAEEALFRGSLQSGLARRYGETRGWAQASLMFGGVHTFNIFFMPSDQRKNYLLYALPWITTVGGYLGWIYKRNDYSLAPPVAAHFWYNLLLSVGYFALDPQNSPISAKIAVPF